MTPEQMGAAWMKLHAIKKLSERVEAAIKGAVLSGIKIPLPTGKTLISEERSRRSIGVESAENALRALGASDEEIRSLVKVSRWTQPVER
jgi:molybdopterin-binding protein